MSSGKRVFISAIIGVSFLVCVAIALADSFREPVYGGKPLSQWVSLFDGHPGSPAAQPLLQIGDKAVPWLTRMLNCRDTPLRIKVMNLLDNQKLVKFRLQPASVIQRHALDACNTLKVEARRKLAPALARLVRDCPAEVDMETGRYAVDVLANCGPEGIQALVTTLTSSGPSTIRLRAAELLGTAPESGTPAVLTVLKSCVGDPDGNIRQAAVLAIQLLAHRQNQTLPPASIRWDMSGPSNGPLAENLWKFEDIRRLSDSGISGSSDWRGMFDRGVTTPSGEIGATTFQDSQPDGFVHFIEWETTQPVTIDSIGVVSGCDGSHSQNQRAFREFRLYARTNAAEPFTLFYAEDLSVPYWEGAFDNFAYIFRNLPQPVTATQFRAEFIQNGNGMWCGPRVMGLYGFGQTLNLPMVAKVLDPLNPERAALVSEFLHDVPSRRY